MTEKIEKLNKIIKNPKIEPATACVIWLHGLGADGHDFSKVIPELGLPADHSIRFVFPHAPHRAVTINAGMHMPAWYDIIGLTLEARQDAQGIELAQQQIVQLIEEQHEQGIAYDHIFLVGFSQGGALAFYTGLSFAHKLGGVAGLSTYVPMQEALKKSAKQPLPLFMAHGLTDPIVSLSLGEHSLAFLQSLDYQVEWHTYPMLHSVCQEELIDLGKWLVRNS